MTLWSGRFDTAPDPQAFDFGVSFGFDRALFEDDVTGSIAWAEALGAAGVLSDGRRARDRRRPESDPRRRAARSRRSSQALTKTFTASSSASWSSALATPAGGCIPAGRATSRCRSTCGCICVAAFRRCRRASRRWSAACADQAERAGSGADAVLHAPAPRPAGAGRALLSVARRRACAATHARLAAAADEADALTLGSGAVAGTSYPVDTALLARALGFSRIVRNSMDASSDRDFVASFLYAASMAMVHLSRLAEDLIIFTGEEHGFFDLADCVGDRQQHDAAEEESRPAGARARQDRPRDRPADRLAGHDEGAAERIQQGFAGGQGSGL